ncbi:MULTISPECIES: ATP-binding protein [Streptomyces]|uniref:ATP-binding protein n=1 Tax=Streptomyces TaxID=1883 RepID=UPI0027E305F2|nr:MULTISPECIES: ATP-binding protein [Streptomyces]
MNDWGHPYTSGTNETITLVTAELTANAVRHGHVPGRDFHLRLTQAGGTLRIEVTDTRAEKLPATGTPDPEGESDRGLLLVEALTDDWGVTPRETAPGKTVWAEFHDRIRPVHRQLGSPGMAVPPSQADAGERTDALRSQPSAHPSAHPRRLTWPLMYCVRRPGGGSGSMSICRWITGSACSTGSVRGSWGSCCSPSGSLG